jgi:hypothetical protein
VAPQPIRVLVARYALREAAARADQRAGWHRHGRSESGPLLLGEASA